MNSRHIMRTLDIIKTHLKEVLEPESEYVINRAIVALKKSKANYDKYQRRKDLLCELVVANFFPNQYQNIRPKPDWHWAVKTCERYLLERYHAECLAAIRNRKKTLLSALWNRNG